MAVSFWDGAVPFLNEFELRFYGVKNDATEAEVCSVVVPESVVPISALESVAVECAVVVHVVVAYAADQTAVVEKGAVEAADLRFHYGLS